MKYIDSTHFSGEGNFFNLSKIQSKNKKYIYVYVKANTKQNSAKLSDSSQDNTNIPAVFIQQKVIRPHSSCSADLDFLLM